jgi:uncharacterized protein YlxW (UPF0749 family)
VRRQAGGRGQGQGLVLPIILLVVGFLVSAAVVRERAHEERLPRQAAELIDLVRRRQATIRTLTADVGELSARLAQAQETGARESVRVRQVLGMVGRLRVPAGFEAVRGPGVTVELADSPDAPRTRGEITDFRIQDVDLQLVVNQLWAAGAEAVAVNGRRVTATTAIRQAGDVVLVNFHAVSSPYRVRAIGDPADLRSRTLGSEIGRQFALWTQVYGLGFAVRQAEAVTIPALAGSADLGWARPEGT